MRELNLSHPIEIVPIWSPQWNGWDQLFNASFSSATQKCDIRRNAIVGEAFLQSVRDESICRTSALHSHEPSYRIDDEVRKRLMVFDKFWYYCEVRSVSSHRPSSSIDRCINPRGVEMLDPTLPPSTNPQNIVEEASTNQVPTAKDGNDFPNVNISSNNPIGHWLPCI